MLLFSAIVIGLIIRLCLSWQDVEKLILKCIADDAFMYFTLSRNIALGNGVSFDGLSPTNGFHPLYASLLVPIFKFYFNDIDTPVHIALTMLSIFNVLTVIFIFKIVKMLTSKKIALLTSLIWLFNPYVILITLTGTEASLYAFLISISIYYYLKIRLKNEYTLKNLFILGIIVGITFLCRTEAIFLFIAIFLDMSYRLFREDEFKFSFDTFSKVGVYFLSALLVVSPWLIWNLATFGTIIQNSQQALVYNMHSKFLYDYKTYFHPCIVIELISNVCTGIIMVFEHALAWRILSAFVVGLILGVILTRVPNILQNKQHKIRNLNFILIFSILWLFFYSFYLWLFQRWYFMSVMLVSTLFIGLCIDLVCRVITPGLSRWFLLLFFILLLGVFWMKGRLLWERGFYPHQQILYQMSIWINENILDNQRIGAFDVGILGYYNNINTNSRTIISLDGAMNNEVIEVIKNNQLLEYIIRKKINYIVSSPYSPSRNRLKVFLGNKYPEFISRLAQVYRIDRSPQYCGGLVLYKFE